MRVNDIKENDLLKIDSSLLDILLKDRTTGKNIVWATDDYLSHGDLYMAEMPMAIGLVTGRHGRIIRPRIEKSQKEQRKRATQKAEVFTASWICNCQNNLIDDAWFGRTNTFNVETYKGWETNRNTIIFPKDKNWKDYICEIRLEVSCGEAPYLTSRYDAVSGKSIIPNERIGLLDRKLRVITENVTDENEWIKWAEKALKSCYGYDLQGDNVLLARENVLYTIVEHYEDIFHKTFDSNNLIEFAKIVSWNIFQMNGIKFTTPYSKLIEMEQLTFDSLFEDFEEVEQLFMPGLAPEIPTKIMDWDKRKVIEFRSLLKEGHYGY